VKTCDKFSVPDYNEPKGISQGISSLNLTKLSLFPQANRHHGPSNYQPKYTRGEIRTGYLCAGGVRWHPMLSICLFCSQDLAPIMAVILKINYAIDFQNNGHDWGQILAAEQADR
jgi:hypothetical protein